MSVPPPGSEPTATALPPFVPQAAESTRGTGGESLSLMTAESGGLTRNGEALDTDTEVTPEANGSSYALTLDDTTWSPT